MGGDIWAAVRPAWLKNLFCFPTRLENSYYDYDRDGHLRILRNSVPAFDGIVALQQNAVGRKRIRGPNQDDHHRPVDAGFFVFPAPVYQQFSLFGRQVIYGRGLQAPSIKSTQALSVSHRARNRFIA
ncbi:MAG: hypothetical protein JW966_11635 [Anaerolineae bacterium]|nr:hypothetical protein [Anaerolineae bacterium]